MVRIAQASKDERSRYTGGQAGNQSGSELNIREWYSRPWDTVLRPKTPELAQSVVSVSLRLVKCTLIGYDQSQRTTLYEQCERIGWDINRLNEIQPCECDCSSLIAVILRFCGISIPKTVYTGNLTSYVLATGQFLCLRDPKYLTGDAYLKAGDIVLNTAHHVAVAVDTGAKALSSTFTPYAAVVDVSSFLNVREGPGTWYPVFKVSGTDFRLPNGLVVAIIEEVDGWGRLSNLDGWVSLSYLQR